MGIDIDPSDTCCTHSFWATYLHPTGLSSNEGMTPTSFCTDWLFAPAGLYPKCFFTNQLLPVVFANHV